MNLLLDQQQHRSHLRQLRCLNRTSCNAALALTIAQQTQACRADCRCVSFSSCQACHTPMPDAQGTIASLAFQFLLITPGPLPVATPRAAPLWSLSVPPRSSCCMSQHAEAALRSPPRSRSAYLSCHHDATLTPPSLMQGHCPAAATASRGLQGPHRAVSQKHAQEGDVGVQVQGLMVLAAAHKHKHVALGRSPPQAVLEVAADEGRGRVPPHLCLDAWAAGGLEQLLQGPWAENLACMLGVSQRCGLEQLLGGPWAESSACVLGVPSECGSEQLLRMGTVGCWECSWCVRRPLTLWQLLQGTIFC